MRKVRTVLGYLRRLDLLPRLSNDELRDALARLPVTTERIEYLKPAELQKLLEAALRHDADTVISRDEEQHLRLEARKRGITRAAMAAIQPRGTTPRYEPIAPFTVACLLGGFRLGEAIDLDWKRVDLDALDHEREQVGEIYVAGAGAKTHKARTVGARAGTGNAANAPQAAGIRELALRGK